MQQLDLVAGFALHHALANQHGGKAVGERLLGVRVVNILAVLPHIEELTELRTGVIEDAIEDDLEALAMRFGYKIQHELVGFRPFPRCGVLGFVDQFRQGASIAEIIVHMAVVGGVVLVQTGRLENRIQIEARNPEAAQIGKRFADALNVAAVAPVVHVVAAPPACAGRGAGSGSTPLHRPRHGIRRVVRLIAVAEALLAHGS